METRFNGGCHCGNLKVEFETTFRPSEIPLRADSCSFCSKHGARTAADPCGRARLTIHDPSELIRYRFGLRTADFLVCRRCGVYVGAALSAAGKWYVTLNVNAFDPAPELIQSGRPVSYDGETESERIGRRIANWTPLLEIREGTV